ncbi:MAG: hypothetical protein KDD33_00395 [Bdellovibrionales bacterium]|nr:hypothetical protein [Bdellovibrionales bacterium]
MFRIALLIPLFFMMAAASLPEYRLPSPSAEGVDEVSLFQQYCGSSVDPQSAEIPRVNYDDPLVWAATEKLNTVAPVSIYLYHHVISNYGFAKGVDKDFPWDVYANTDPDDDYENILEIWDNQQYGEKKDWDTGESEFDVEYLKRKFDYEYFHKNPSYRQPKGVKGNTHAFLTYLCGEFRDRPTLIKEKLTWFSRMIKLPVKAQEKINASKNLKNIWLKISAESYAPYIKFSRALYDAKEAANRVMVPLANLKVDKPVPAYTICETKHIFTEYVTNGNKKFPGYETYMKGFMGDEFETGLPDSKSYKMAKCSQEDRDYYYDFRGDSNIKPNSPESNAMIWQANSIMQRCKRNEKGKVSLDPKVNSEWFDVANCSGYMTSPFYSRWNAARSALVTWLAYDRQFDDIFAGHGSYSIIFKPTLTPETEPFGFTTSGEDYWGVGSHLLPEWVQNASTYWTQSDAGLNDVFEIANGKTGQLVMAYERIRNAVDRHTDWYQTGYDDTHFEPTLTRTIDQAFSPFVASSYEMSESDGFTAPGLTVRAPADNKKQWMFVFRVHKDKWYNTDTLLAGKPLDLNWQWFDETSFGTSHLADSERAWDRLGTALEGEMDSILYLHNIERGAIKGMSGTPKVYDDGLGATH